VNAQPPGPHHPQIIKQITHLTAVAIERKRSAESLRASELLARANWTRSLTTLDARLRNLTRTDYLNMCCGQ